MKSFAKLLWLTIPLLFVSLVGLSFTSNTDSTIGKIFLLVALSCVAINSIIAFLYPIQSKSKVKLVCMLDNEEMDRCGVLCKDCPHNNPHKKTSDCEILGCTPVNNPRNLYLKHYS